MATVPVFTPVPGGFITAQPIGDGRFVVESWRLNMTPDDAATPYSTPVHHCIATETEFAGLVAEFTPVLARLHNRQNA
ncbi:hypothetical protein [Streptomyces prasinopilosus]|uniref:hypothetical protein n=1 Tax=Streptomyces prasinopilosus TaxID=67344 RepID=UPI0006EBCC6C|nr:hypothetical protein [Streptomyces prasinopilosus]